jgi:L-rhamnose mutarotase
MRQLIALLFFASSLSAADLPKYWSVHVDHVTDRVAYEELHKQEYAIQRDVLAAHNVPRTAGWKFSTSDGTYFNFRGRASTADLEKPSATPTDVRKEIDAKQASLEPRIHASLREHHNELWQTDTDVTSLPDTHAPKFIRYRVDVVVPGKDEMYGDVQKAVRAVMEKHGVAVLALYGAYGDGAYHYLFMSDRPVDVKAIVGPEVMKQWRACVVSAKESDAKARPDLTLTDPAKWIQ